MFGLARESIAQVDIRVPEVVPFNGWGGVVLAEQTQPTEYISRIRGPENCSLGSGASENECTIEKKSVPVGWRMVYRNEACWLEFFQLRKEQRVLQGVRYDSINGTMSVKETQCPSP